MDGTRRDARRQSDAEPCQARFAPGEAGGIWVNRTFFSQRWHPLVSHPATRAVQVAERVRRAHRHRLSQRSQCDPPGGSWGAPTAHAARGQLRQCEPGVRSARRRPWPHDPGIAANARDAANVARHELPAPSGSPSCRRPCSTHARQRRGRRRGPSPSSARQFKYGKSVHRTRSSRTGSRGSARSQSRYGGQTSDTTQVNLGRVRRQHPAGPKERFPS